MERAFGVPPTTDPGKENEGVLAFERGIIGHNDVGGTTEGYAGTGTTGAAEEAGALEGAGGDTSFLFASCSLT